MPRLTFLILAASALVATLGAGCGSASHVQSTGAGPTGPTTPATPSSSAPVPPTATASIAGGSATAGVPAVSNASDLHAKPQIGAGQPPKPTTLVSKDLVVGAGTVATAASTVSVQYIGVNYDDGKEFDSSWAAGGKPVDFPLTGVIPGFSQGIVGMKVGGRRELVIPPDLGYGASGHGPVGPNETLVFVIDLVAVK